MRFAVYFLIVFLSVATVAYAQISGDIRVSDNDGYSRVVFDLSQKSGYTVEKNGNSLSVSFKEALAVSPKAQTARNITTIQKISDQNFTLSIPEGSHYRSFTIGNRIIIDVYDKAGQQTAKPKPSEKPVKQPEPPEPEQKKEKQKDITLEELTAQNKAVQAIEKIAEQPVEETEKKLSGIQPNVITFTATETVGMAAFLREGFLWLVFDDPALKTDPVIAGPNKNEFGDLKKFPLPDGVAYRMQAPEGYRFYGEGGGLVWRVVMTPNPRRVKALYPMIEDVEGTELSTRALKWMVKNSRKKILFEDPLVGDVIAIVTVPDSSAFTGEARSYPQVDVLDSVIGLAFVPKADTLTTSLSADAVMVTAAGGLAVSEDKDAKAVQIKDDIKAEEDEFEAEENPSTITRLFDFDRWEMGGIKALEENRRVLMRSIGNKQGAAKVEDLLTLAKLSLANDRGQEALGLLRVAEQDLPGIEENPEFIGMRGASSALAGKHDEGIELLFHPKIKDNGEIAYWKAFSLAGLEDWKQADQIMPADLSLLSSYPKQIRQPMTLAFAETALRAGKADRAEELLNSLQDDFPTMTLPRRSAWKYLNGELERQRGNDDKAFENWETLIAGQDDYFRAKAGLSMTRLQLDRQKITMEKAIDRLEGLRYAWRGDELETLINFRLGEVYVQNKDYLKGLSTLRNAVSLSPDAKITEDVTTYMTDTFRSLFNDGKLSDLSALDAVTIYDEFKELTPIGREGDLFIETLAERLVDVDLLGRAAGLLDYQMRNRLEGEDKIRTAIRLAGIYLLDGKAEPALETLAIAEATAGAQVEQRRAMTLLKARALSKSGKAREGLSLLNGLGKGEDVMRLKADIAWGAALWREAAEAFASLMATANISKTRPPEKFEADLIMNRAIALNLSDSRAGLASLKEAYGDVMKQTDRAQIFDLVTRPRQAGLVGNDSSITSLISEVDLFGNFLESYKTAQ